MAVCVGDGVRAVCVGDGVAVCVMLSGLFV